MANKRHRLSLPELSEKLLFPRWLQDGSRMAQDGSRWPQVDQDSLLGAFLGLQTLSWKALDPQKPVKTNGLTFALPLLCLRFASVSPLFYLPLPEGQHPSANSILAEISSQLCTPPSVCKYGQAFRKIQRDNVFRKNVVHENTTHSLSANYFVRRPTPNYKGPPHMGTVLVPRARETPFKKTI